MRIHKDVALPGKLVDEGRRVARVAPWLEVFCGCRIEHDKEEILWYGQLFRFGLMDPQVPRGLCRYALRQAEHRGNRE